MRHVGVDVAAKTLQVAVDLGETFWEAEFPNNASGHKKLILALAKHSPCRVVLEATSLYSLDPALALTAAGVHVMVANPRKVSAFARAVQRGKTDPMDARLLARFSAAFEFVAWTPPTQLALELRQLTRRVLQLIGQTTAEKNRLGVLLSTGTTSKFLIEDVREHIAELEARVAKLERQALELAAQDEAVQSKVTHLTTVPGIAQRSAVRLVAELLFLPEDMDTKQLVAYAGLDPRPWKSGTGVSKPPRISKRGNIYVRTALYMPALAAVRCDANVRAFQAGLVARGKKPKQAQVAVMRKLLHSAWAMLRSGQPWNPEKFHRSGVAA